MLDPKLVRVLLLGNAHHSLEVPLLGERSSLPEENWTPCQSYMLPRLQNRCCYLQTVKFDRHGDKHFWRGTCGMKLGGLKCWTFPESHGRYFAATNDAGVFRTVIAVTAKYSGSAYVSHRRICLPGFLLPKSYC